MFSHFIYISILIFQVSWRWVSSSSSSIFTFCLTKIKLTIISSPIFYFTLLHQCHSAHACPMRVLVHSTNVQGYCSKIFGTFPKSVALFALQWLCKKISDHVVGPAVFNLRVSLLHLIGSKEVTNV
jgi:hypothetical protein